MLRTLAAALVVSTAVLPSVPVALAQTSTPTAAADRPGEVSARATARVYRRPDHLDIVIGIETVATTAGEAHQECATKMEAVLKAVKDMNLDKADLKTGTVGLSPRYERRNYEEGTPAKIIGYTAINTVRVRTADLKAAPRIIDVALKNGANRVDGLEFGIKEVLEAREEALRMATRAAKRKAQVMAESLETSLGRIVSISETTQQFGGWRGHSNLAQVQMANDSGPVPGEESIEPGQIEIVVDVVLTYTLK
ncbi:MAG: SIMPL domain-containing protein [Phycisphaerales bacterium]|nr:SIMPL domain-containing protein [Phycisphaerales bacterium]